MSAFSLGLGPLPWKSLFISSLAGTSVFSPRPSPSPETEMLLNVAAHYSLCLLDFSFPLCSSEFQLSSTTLSVTSTWLSQILYFLSTKNSRTFLLHGLLHPTSPRIPGSGYEVVSIQHVQGGLRAREDRKQMVMRPAKQNRAATFVSAMNTFIHTVSLCERDTLRRRDEPADVWGEKFWYDWCRNILCIWLLSPELTCPGKNRFSFENFTLMTYVHH